MSYINGDENDQVFLDDFQVRPDSAPMRWPSATDRMLSIGPSATSPLPVCNPPHVTGTCVCGSSLRCCRRCRHAFGCVATDESVRPADAVSAGRSLLTLGQTLIT